MSDAEQTPMQKLFGAVYEGDLDLCRNLVDSNPELLGEYAVGGTWLHQAARRNDIPMTEFFLAKGIEVDAGTENTPDTPLIDAVSKGNLEAAGWLLDHGADPNKGRIMIAAANSGSLGVVELLVERGADVNATFINENSEDRHPMNALGQAESLGYEEMASYLRSVGAVLPSEVSAKAHE